ncbi:MAG: nickel-dependent lactate racemase [Dehalococcoidales bacterium]|nr:nickel-dependent lactate racemase [Dehalococcoidales bacterium]
MQLEIPYLRDKISVNIADNRVAGIISGNDVPIGNENETIKRGIENPINSKSLRDFLKDAEGVLFIVNDATRPTPTVRILENIFQIIKPSNPKFLVATGTHPAPTQEEYSQIFGRLYSKYKTRIYAHDSRADKDMVCIGTSRNGTSLYVNKLVVEASRIIVISSVEPHYFAGYTGGRKSLFPGVASFKSIEQNHRHAMDPGAKALALEGNPVHEDMVDALKLLDDKEMFAIMTVLDKEHRVYATTAGDINDSFLAAVEQAKKVFVVKIKEKADIVVTVARFPMDINLYQSQKALDNGKLALKDGGILILVSSCRAGIGDDSFIKLLSSCNSPTDVFDRIKEGYRLGAHKAAKLAEINLWAEMYGVTSLPDDVLKNIFIKPFPSLQDALDSALKKKGKQAKILFMLDGSLTVPTLE